MELTPFSASWLSRSWPADASYCKAAGSTRLISRFAFRGVDDERPVSKSINPSLGFLIRKAGTSKATLECQLFKEETTSPRVRTRPVTNTSRETPGDWRRLMSSRAKVREADGISFGVGGWASGEAYYGTGDLGASEQRQIGNKSILIKHLSGLLRFNFDNSLSSLDLFVAVTTASAGPFSELSSAHERPRWRCRRGWSPRL